MDLQPKTESNVEQAVPFFMVTDIEASLRFYIEGLGFTMTKKWTPRGKIEWCWLELGGAALMLQEYRSDRVAANKRGEGVSICFQCRDAIAIYRDAEPTTSSPDVPSSATPCGSRSCTTPTATRSTSKAPPTHPKSPLSLSNQAKIPHT